MLALRLPAEVEKCLEALAKSIGYTKSFHSREAILSHLDNVKRDLGLAY